MTKQQSSLLIIMIIFVLAVIAYGNFSSTKRSSQTTLFAKDWANDASLPARYR